MTKDHTRNSNPKGGGYGEGGLIKGWVISFVRTMCLVITIYDDLAHTGLSAWFLESEVNQRGWVKSSLGTHVGRGWVFGMLGQFMPLWSSSSVIDLFGKIRLVW